MRTVAGATVTTIRLLQLVVGILTLGLGLFMILRREAIVSRQRARLSSAQPAMLWLVLGGLLALVGVFQLAAYAL